MARHQRLRGEVFNTPWAIEKRQVRRDRLLRATALAGREFTAQEIRARLGGEPPSARRLQQTGRVAVIPIVGVLAQHMNLITEASGGTASTTIRRDVQAALADPNVASIVLAIDSPGGSRARRPRSSRTELREARRAEADPRRRRSGRGVGGVSGSPPGHEIIVTPSGYVGSVGVVCAHEDMSEQQRQEGIRTTIITSAKYKARGPPVRAADGRSARRIAAQVRRDGRPLQDGCRGGPGRQRGDGEGHLRRGAYAQRAAGARRRDDRRHRQL